MEKQTRRSQLIVYVLISYAILWLLFGLSRIFDIPFTYDPRQIGGIMVLLGIPASLLASISTTLLIPGGENIKQLFSRSFRWQFSIAWYFGSLLAPILVTLLSAVAAVWINNDIIPIPWFSPSMPLGFMIFFLIYIGFGEEIGWRGFALPRFQYCFGSLGGSVLVGILWALWHLPLFLMPGSSQFGSLLVPYIFLLTCWTVVMALFVGKSHGSVIPGILLHGSANFVAFTIRYPHHYVYFFWGLAAILATIFLPRPLFTLRII